MTGWPNISATDAAVQICNMALSHIGLPPVVSKIDPPDGSTESRYCAQFYPQALRVLIQQHPWNSFTRVEPLSLLQTRDERRLRYIYSKPPGTVQVWDIGLPDYYELSSGLSQPGLWYRDAGTVGDDHYETTLRRWKAWRAEIADNQVPVIATSLPDAWGRYTHENVAAANYSPTFTEALAYLLATYLAFPLRNETKLIKELRAQYGVVLDQAKALDAREGDEGTDQHTPDWIGGRQRADDDGYGPRGVSE